MSLFVIVISSTHLGVIIPVLLIVIAAAVISAIVLRRRNRKRGARGRSIITGCAKSKRDECC